MNELRTLDPFAFDPIDDAFRSLMRPWRMDVSEAAPRIKMDLSERDGILRFPCEHCVVCLDWRVRRACHQPGLLRQGIA